MADSGLGREARLDTAVAETRRAVRTCLADVEPGQRVLVACSGGADSLALAAATVFEAGKGGWLVGAVVVDHGLQADSAQVARIAADQLSRLGFDDVDVVEVAVADDGGGPEAAARSARYAALDSAATAADDAIVLLGHTREDQAESVVLGLLRGSGIRSLAGMAPVRGRYRRPFLAITHDETLEACTSLGLTVWRDPHNDDVRFTRVRVRDSVLPAIEEALGHGAVLGLARTADLARADADALDNLAQAAYEQIRVTPDETDAVSLDLATLAVELLAIRRRVLRLAALAAGSAATDLTSHHIDQVERLITRWHGQHGVDLPGVVVTRVGGVLRYAARAAQPSSDGGGSDVEG